MTEEVRRIFVDSRLKSVNSASNSNFSIDLPMEVSCPAGTQCRIENVCLSIAWPTVSSHNNKLYLKEILDTGQSYNRIVVIRPGVYNKGQLVAELQDKMRDGTVIADGQWFVSLDDNNIVFRNSSPTASSVIYSRDDILSKNAIPIFYTTPSGEYIGSTNEWPVIWSAATSVEALPSVAEDICEVIGVMRERLQLAPNQSRRCSHIDLQPHKVLYLCSDRLPSNSMDLRGRSDIVKAIMIGNAAPGQVLVDSLPNTANFSHFAAFTVLKHIDFTVRDHRGGICDLYNHQISFQIEFIRPADL